MVIKDKSTPIKLINITKSGPICKQKKGFFYKFDWYIITKKFFFLPIIL